MAPNSFILLHAKLSTRAVARANGVLRTAELAPATMMRLLIGRHDARDSGLGSRVGMRVGY